MAIKIRNWRRVWSRLIGIDVRVAEYGDLKFLLEKRKGVPAGRRWKLEIYSNDKIIVRTGHPNLMIAKAKAEEWLNNNYGAISREQQSCTA